MPYPEHFVAPMRQELTRFGVKELRTAEEVDAAINGTAGTTMIVVNSVCGCAAGKARPGVVLALAHPVKPDLVATVFAGADIDATDRARSYFSGRAPSSPSIALLREGQLLYMLERHQIEGRSAGEIAAEAGVKLGASLYSDALGEPGSDGDTYLKMMRNNVTAIVTALGS